MSRLLAAVALASAVSVSAVSIVDSSGATGGSSSPALDAPSPSLPSNSAGAHPFHETGDLAARERTQHKRHMEPFPFAQAVIEAESEDDFNRILQNQPLSLVMFHAPWSYACQEFYKTFDAAATELGRGRPRITTVAVDVSKAPQLGQRYRINAFPTVTVFRAGIEGGNAENQVPRDARHIVRHMRGLLRPAADEVESVGQFRTLVDPATEKPVQGRGRGSGPVGQGQVVVFGFLEDGANQDVFLEVARLLQLQQKFAFSAEHAVARAMRRSYDSVVIYKSFDDSEPSVLDIKDEDEGGVGLRRDALLAFIAHNVFPRVGEFTEATQVMYTHRRQPILFYFTQRPGPSGNEHFAELDVVARAFPNVSVVQVNPMKFPLIAGFLNVNEIARKHGWALGLIVGKLKFRYEDDMSRKTGFGPTSLSADSAEEFVEKALAGRWPVHLKSATEPQPRPEIGSGDVIEIVRRTVDELVLKDVTRDALLLLYNPKHAPSTEALSAFEDAAKMLRGASGIVVGKFDVTENDTPEELTIPGFPSILYTKRSDKTTAIRMVGTTKTPQNIVAFVRKHATVPLPQAPSLTNRTPGRSHEAEGDL